MAPLGASALDGVPVAIYDPAVATGSAVQEDLDVSLGRELSYEVFAEAGLVARHDEVVSGHNGHTSIFHETVLRVKVGGAGRGCAGLFRWRGRAVVALQRFQKLVGGQDGAAGAAGRVLDPPVGADDDRAALPVA